MTRLIASLRVGTFSFVDLLGLVFLSDCFEDRLLAAEMLLSIGDAAKQFELKGHSNTKTKTNFIQEILENLNLMNF
ncbi:hypothetical protein N9L75_04595 [Porticoccaceae bacterium]|nr:hypothetical protein [Porticoccaceae bacterium]MDA8664019.1 hypothetical protein [Porticoccaceae bacterium]